MKAIHGYEGKRIILDVGSVMVTAGDGGAGHGLLFQANIRREITERNQEKRIERASAILAAWKDDVADFNDLVAKFDARGTSR